MALFAGARSKRWIEKLIEATRKNNNDDYAAALQKLISFGSDALPEIIDALDFVGAEERTPLTKALAKIIDNSNLLTSLKALDHPNSNVVSEVMKAIANARKINAGHLLPYLKDDLVPNNKIFPILTARKDELDASRLISAAYDLEMNDKESVFKIVEEIATNDSIPDLLSRATGKDPVVRGHIIRLLGNFNDTRVSNVLQGLLSDKNSIVRQAALESLTKTGNTADVQSLCELLSDSDFGVQERAVEAIVKLNHPNTARYLLDTLKSENEYARRSAVEVLNSIGTVENMKQLITAILDQDWWVRARAADALSKIGGPKVVDAVLGLIRDDNEDIRRTAVEILVSARDPRAEQQLVKALQDEDWWVRERAADALAEMGSGDALDGLTKILGQHPKSDPIIIRSIGKLGNEYNVPQLVPFLQQDNDLIRIETIKALNDLTGKDTVKSVMATYKDLATKVENMEVKDALRIGIRRLDRAFFSILMQEDKPAPVAATQGAAAPAQGATPPIGDTASRAGVDEKLEQSPHQDGGMLDVGKLKGGDLIDSRYKYLKRIGKGAFGTVVLVEDIAVGEEIILKFLNAHIASDEETMKRFVHELKFSRKITHPNVIRIFDFLKIRGVYAISMEFFPSKELADVIGGKPMVAKRAARICSDICKGMTEAHKVGIIHRDLKPANVLINNKDVVKVVDFGVAAAQSSGGTDLTKTGFVIGSPKYMAPEQILGKKVDPRADVYATGVILYEMLTGTAPYTKGDHMAVMYQHVQGSAQAAHVVNPALDEGLSAVVTKAMTVNRNNRYQSMQEMIADLEKFC